MQDWKFENMGYFLSQILGFRNKYIIFAAETSYRLSLKPIALKKENNGNTTTEILLEGSRDAQFLGGIAQALHHAEHPLAADFASGAGDWIATLRAKLA